jgi:protein PhnA
VSVFLLHIKVNLLPLFSAKTYPYKMEDAPIVVKDVNGNILADGDTVVLIKDLKVKGTSVTLKKGTTVKKIKLTEDDQEIDCRVNGTSIVLRTEFVKKG